MSSDISKNVIWPGWETVRLIGRGSFGAVYEIQRDVAGETEKAALKHISIPKDKSEINMLRQQNYDDESITAYFTDYKGMFEREYSMMMRMKGHANIVYCEDIRTVQQDDGFGWDIYIKMELLEPLTERIKDGMTEEQIIKLGRDMCSALMYCEKMNVIHRDIKPENIFITREGNYKLGDFGIARTLEGTRTGTVTGTPSFMAPEVANNRRYNSTADIYSLGLTLYWLLNGHTGPFLTPGKKPTPSEKQAAQDRRLRGYSLPDPKYGSSKLNKVVLKACEYDPKERYQTAKEMLDELKKLIAPKHAAPAQPGRGRTENSRTTYRSEKSVREKTATKHSQSGEPKAQRKSFSLKKVWFLIPCVLLLAVMLIWRGFSGSSEESTPASTPTPVSTTEPTPMPTPEPTPMLAPVSTPETTFMPATVSMPVSAAMPVSTVKAVDIASGYEHIVVLKSDGTVVAAGDNSWGQCDVQDWTDIVAVSADNNSTYGLKSDGTVVTTIKPMFGYQSDTADWAEVEDINSGGICTIGVKSDGTVVCGDVYFDDYNIADSMQGWRDIVAVSAGHAHTVGLKSDGTVVAVGDNSWGQCDVQDWTDIIAVIANDSETYGLKSDGTVISTIKYMPTYPWRDVVAISVSGYGTVGLKSDGTVVTGDLFAYEQFRVHDWTDIISIYTSACATHTDHIGIFIVGTKSDGSLLIETNSSEILQMFEELAVELDTNIIVMESAITPTPTPAPTPKPTPVSIIKPTSAIVDVSSGKEHVVFLKSDGTAVAVGANSAGECNVQGWQNIISTSAGWLHTVGLRSDGTVVAVGNNAYGQCDVEGWTDIVAVSAGDFYTVGLKSDGTVLAVGENYYGECDVQNWTDIVAISVGFYHTVGLKSDGTVVAVGDNVMGQCAVQGGTNMVAVSAGDFHTVGLKSDGTVVAVGNNTDGKCDVEGWTDIVAISAGCSHTVGLKADGTVTAVGSNRYGQINVQDWTDVVAIYAGKSDVIGMMYTLGLKSDGTVLIATESEELRQQIESVL